MITASARSTLREALVRYAGTLHAAAPGEQHVLSPLGAYLLLGLLAPAAEGSPRSRLEAALGMDAGAAREAVEELLAAPHPALAAAVALWTRIEAPALEHWAADLPASATRGPLPDQAGLDAWASERTFGLIETFPLQVRPDTLAILASALATRVRWETPFDVTDAARLSGPWSTRVSRVLLSSSWHPVGVVDTAVGRVGVHLAVSEGCDLVVASVIAAPDVPRPDLLDIAHEVATGVVRDDDLSLSRRVDPFDLPLGDGASWTVAEENGTVFSPDGKERVARALMPAWEASTRLDLIQDEHLGFTAAGRVLAGLLSPQPAGPVGAVQTAVARYTATGFEAAAITGVAVGMSLRRGLAGLVRTLEVRFAHPYAVVAVTRQRDRFDASPERGGPWHGLPVFSAWVDTPTEAEPPTSVWDVL